MFITRLNFVPFFIVIQLFIPILQTSHAQERLTVFKNGKIITVNGKFEISSAIAFQNGKIKFVGTDATKILIDEPNAHVIDLLGKTMMPGLMDSHCHPVGAATYEHVHEIPDIQDIAQLLDYISARTRIQPEGSIINIRQVFITRLKEQRYPTRTELDAVAPKHPVVFSTGPDNMLNSLALRLAGIDGDYQVPQGSAGFIEKDANAHPIEALPLRVQQWYTTLPNSFTIDFVLNDKVQAASNEAANITRQATIYKWIKRLRDLRLIEADRTGMYTKI